MLAFIAFLIFYNNIGFRFGYFIDIIAVIVPNGNRKFTVNTIIDIFFFYRRFIIIIGNHKNIYYFKFTGAGGSGMTENKYLLDGILFLGCHFRKVDDNFLLGAVKENIVFITVGNLGQEFLADGSLSGYNHIIERGKITLNIGIHTTP